MENLVTFGDETTIGHMEDINVKEEFDTIALDIVKHELPLNEIKYEICSDKEDNTDMEDNKLSEKILVHSTPENDEPNQDESKHLNKGESIDHVGKKLHQCKICEKRFKQKGNLIIHKRIHAGEKLFECNVCKKRFSRKYGLKSHKLTHATEKLFECHVCQKKFATDKNLTGHLAMHEVKAHECVVCKRAFRKASSLYSHLRIHTGEKPFQCQICKKKVHSY